MRFSPKFITRSRDDGRRQCGRTHREIPPGVGRVHEGEPRTRQEAVVCSGRREPHEPPGLRRVRVGRGCRGHGPRRIDPSEWQVLMQAWRRRTRTDASNWTKISTYSLTTESPGYQEWTGHMSPSYRSWQL